MGCCSSNGKAGPAVPQERRRRLSLADVQREDGDDQAAVPDEDRGLISALDSQNIIELLDEEVGDRKMSVSSETDQQKKSFANKSMRARGDELDPVANSIGYTCRKGLKPESPNQDSWFVLKVDQNFSIFAVFDGHGKQGHDVSNYVKDWLPKMIIRDQRFKSDDMTEMLKDSFKRTQSLLGSADRMKKISAQRSGTTATVVILDDAKTKLTVSHVADSTAVLGRYTDESRTKLEAVALTRDHKPNLVDERKRIERSGGRVVFDGYVNHRVCAKHGRYPGLNMSRCLGDLMGHADCGLSAEPEVSERKLTSLDHMLLVCSDGVWEFVEPLEAVRIAAEFRPKCAMQAAESIAKEAWDRWIAEEGGAVVDDITVVLAYMNQSN